MLGTVLGVGAFVAILGLTATAGGQIDRHFTELAATGVVVDDVGTGDPADADVSFPDDASARVQRLNGVVHAGVFWPVGLRNPVIANAPAIGAGVTGVRLYAAEPAALAAMRPTVALGRLYDDFHAARGERVAVLGAAAAARLGVSRLDGGPAVFVNDTAYTVIGIVSDLRRDPELLSAVIIATTTALAAYGPPTGERAHLVIETRVGAAGVVAAQAALALRPDRPGLFRVVPPPDPRALRDRVGADVNGLFLLLAAVSLVVGAVGIANTTLVAVLERVHEIGVRRALGARGVHIAAQFLVESTALGLLGGMVGSSLGVAAVVGTAVGHHWTAVLAPWTVVAGPAIGAAVGALAGSYPAVRAGRIEPSDALRR